VPYRFLGRPLSLLFWSVARRQPISRTWSDCIAGHAEPRRNNIVKDKRETVVVVVVVSWKGLKPRPRTTGESSFSPLSLSALHHLSRVPSCRDAIREEIYVAKHVSRRPGRVARMIPTWGCIAGPSSDTKGWFTPNASHATDAAREQTLLLFIISYRIISEIYSAPLHNKRPWLHYRLRTKFSWLWKNFGFWLLRQLRLLRTCLRSLRAFRWVEAGLDARSQWCFKSGGRQSRIRNSRSAIVKRLTHIHAAGSLSSLQASLLLTFRYFVEYISFIWLRKINWWQW